MVEGYEDLVPLVRKKMLAGQAMVFMIQGLYFSWETPIAYFLSPTSINHTDLSTLLLDAITRFIDCGFLVTAMICDQGRNNIPALINALNKNITLYWSEWEKIYSIFDVFHYTKIWEIILKQILLS